MKKFITVVTMLFVIAVTTLSAAVLETVHLKNGSVINGIIIEEKPGEFLKIKTRDGNIFHYNLDEVEKITRSEAGYRGGYSSFSGDGGAKAGYRGFLEAGYTIGVGDYGEGRVDITTSHGYQVCPYFFAGVGVGLNYYTNGEVFGVPLFADLRADILNNNITPFVDFKIGYSVADVSGFYMCPSLGCRFGFGNNLGMHISVGYTYQKYKYKGTIGYYTYNYDDYGYGYSYPSYHSRSFSESVNVGGITLKLGFEF